MKPSLPHLGFLFLLFLPILSTSLTPPDLTTSHSLLLSRNYSALITSLLPHYRTHPDDSQVQDMLVEGLKGSVEEGMGKMEGEGGGGASVEVDIGLILDAFGLSSLLIDLQRWDEATSATR